MKCCKYTCVRENKEVGDKASAWILARTHHSHVQSLSPDPAGKMVPVSQFLLLNCGISHCWLQMGKSWVTRLILVVWFQRVCWSKTSEPGKILSKNLLPSSVPMGLEPTYVTCWDRCLWVFILHSHHSGSYAGHNPTLEASSKNVFLSTIAWNVFSIHNEKWSFLMCPIQKQDEDCWECI